jgi:fluoride exporter
MLKQLMLVMLGGGVGSGLRFGADMLLLRALPDASRAFPWATLAVNLIGCFAAGVLLGLVSREGVRFGPELKVLLITGVCGGLTTFSAFALQTTAISPGKAALNIGLSVAGGLLLAWTGLRLAA